MRETDRAGAALPMGNEFQPKREMEGAHQQVHRDHSGERRRMLYCRAEGIRLSAVENAREQRHDCECRRGRKTEPVDYAECCCMSASARTGPITTTSLPANEDIVASSCSGENPRADHLATIGAARSAFFLVGVVFAGRDQATQAFIAIVPHAPAHLPWHSMAGTRPTCVKRSSVLSPFFAISKTMSVQFHFVLVLTKLILESTTSQTTFLPGTNSVIFWVVRYRYVNSAPSLSVRVDIT
jgi:hypothetical protein